MSERDRRNKAEIVAGAYSKDHWATCPDVYKDLVLKDQNRNHPVPDSQSNRIFRAVLTFDHLRQNLDPGALILDIGCGLGFNTCFLLKEGFNVHGFDGSETGIERSKALAEELDLDPNRFICSDHTYLEEIEENSIDAIIGMGFIYYLDDQARDQTYANISRIIKPGGVVALTLTNWLFDAFSLNDSALRFWKGLIDSHSDVGQLISGGNVIEAIKEKVILPERTKDPKSISQRFSIHADNPITYDAIAKQYGLTLKKVLYPDCHLLPPFIESTLDPDALSSLKAVTCVQKASEWQGVFMDYEFLAFMTK